MLRRDLEARGRARATINRRLRTVAGCTGTPSRKNCSTTHPRRTCAARIVRRAGITKPVGPYTLRHAFITAALDAGVPLRDVQEAASHADPRTTMRYDRARTSLDRHGTCIVGAYVARAAG